MWEKKDHAFVLCCSLEARNKWEMDRRPGRVEWLAELGRVQTIANGGDWNAFVCGAAAWRQETQW